MNDDQKELLQEATLEVVDAMRVLQKSGSDLVKEALGGREFTQWEHYPEKGVYDPETHSQYYFHAHEPSREEWTDFGHFHVFMRKPGINDALKPIDTDTADLPAEQVAEAAHLIGISLDNLGRPVRLFTTNRWVTAETLYSADDVISLLDDFEIDLSTPSWPLNRWLTAMMIVFRGDIEELIRQRDVTLAQWADEHPDANTFEDRELAVTSAKDIDLQARLIEVQSELSL